MRDWMKQVIEDAVKEVASWNESQREFIRLQIKYYPVKEVE